MALQKWTTVHAWDKRKDTAKPELPFITVI